VLKLTLHPTSYDWEFIPVAGQTFTDAGSANCIGAGPAPTATPAPTPAATPTPMPGGSTTMHVGDLDRASSSPSNKWTANVTITIHDANHNPVANATVRGAWSNGASGTASCTTSSNGQCSVSKSDIPKGKNSVTFTVNNATHATLAYASANNHDPDGDSNGATIIVPRP
jgi:hypothetical protein